MIQFPQTPNLNQVFTASGSSWIWNGQYWSYIENNPELKKLAFYDSLSADDIIGLRSELNSKQVVGNYSLSGHTHTASQISDSSSVGRSLLTGVTASAQRTSLGLGNIATLDSGLFYRSTNPSGYLTGNLSIYSLTGHGHQVSDIASLQSILNSALYITGDQSISGAKNFFLRPTINGTGVLLSGEAAKLPSTLLYSTGDQNISGIFTSYLKNGQVKMELGLSNYVQVANNESFDVRRGQVVYLIGGGDDEIASVKLACSTGIATSSNTIGILSQNLTPGETGYAINRGLITGISLNLFNNGDRIYLGPVRGSITNQKLSPPSHLVSLGFVEKAGTGQDQGIAYIKIEDGYQLGDLHDVSIFGAVSGSLLVNDGPLWIPKSPLDLKLIKNDNGCSSVRTLTQAEYDGLAYPEPYADTLYIISDVRGTQFTGVLSVAGKQGIVTLSASDIGGLGTAATLPSGFFYPASNPSGFVTGAAVDPTMFYASNNPSGYITGNLSNYSLTGHTHIASQISDSSAAGRLLLTGADATSQRSSLGLGTIATLASGLFYPASNPSGFITGISQFTYITGDLNGSLLSPSLVNIQGNPISALSPSEGQTLQWNGVAWVPGAVPNGGNGGGGVVYYFNFGSQSGISPINGLPTSPISVSEFGKNYNAGSGSLVSQNLSENSYSLVGGFVTISGQPGVSKIPAGLWDFNIWADISGVAGSANQTQFQIRVNKYNSISGTYASLANSDDIYIYDPATTAQYIGNVTMPQTEMLETDRIYIELWAQKNVNQSRQIRFYFDSLHPSHCHTTIPSVAGNGLVKIIDGVMQSPASQIVNADIAANAQIEQSKINGLAQSLAGKVANFNGCSSIRTLTQAEYDGLAYPEPYADTLYIISDAQGAQFTGVLSVAGKQGVVTLNTSDIQGLGTIAALDSGLFYPASNPSGFATGAAIDTSLFYPASNPSGYITGNLSGYSLTGHTHVASQVSDSSAAGRLLLTGIDAAAQRTSLGLGTIATLASGLFYQSSNPSGYITGNLSGYSLTGHTHVASQISDSSAAGRLLLTGIDAAAQRSSLGLGTIAALDSGLFYPASNPSGYISGAITNINISESAEITQNKISGLTASLNGKVTNFNGCSSIRTLTQAEYNGLVSPEPYSDTLYIISDGNGYAAESYKNTPTILNGQLNLNLAQSKFFYVNLNQNITGFNLSSSIISGAVTSFDLQVESDGNGRTATWFPGVKWNNSTPPTLTANAGKVDTFSFMTHDAGQTWFASIKGQNQ